MDNPEHSQLWAHDIEGAIKNRQSRALLTLDTRDCRSNQEWTIQSTVNFGYTRLKEQSRMDNPEHCQINVRENRRDDNQEWTIQSTVNFGHTRLKEQSRMDNPEELKNKRQRKPKGQSRMYNPEHFNFRHTRLKEQSRMDNPEHCQLWAHDIEGAIKNGQSRALSTLDTRD